MIRHENQMLQALRLAEELNEQRQRLVLTLLTSAVA